MKIITVLGIGLIIIFGLVIFAFNQFIKEMASSFGGNIGTITCVDYNLKAHYFEQYIDTFFVQYPEYQIPDSIKKSYQFKSLDYEHLNLTKFYFQKSPTEIYYIQWNGPGCINIRFSYEPFTNKSQGVFRGDTENKISSKEVTRLKKRFETEIIPKLEKIILAYEPIDSVYIK